jgi:ectoine hydroxylase-related dioxygenase (phytanoyl-CoA dioxygenase family)
VAGRWWRSEDCRLDDLVELLDRPAAAPPRAVEVRSRAPVCEGDALRRRATSADARRALMAEWCDALMGGAGIAVIRRAFDAAGAVDAATALFESLTAEQRASGNGGADHFAKPGASDRIWNSPRKHCLRDPEGFARHNANPLLALVREAWPGPGYQVTAQVNVVNPGGEAQSPHRD